MSQAIRMTEAELATVKAQQAAKSDAGRTSASKVGRSAAQQLCAPPAVSGAIIKLTLPMPPSWNHYYGQRRSGGKFIRPAGVAFRRAVADAVAEAGHLTMEGRVSLFVAVHPATRAKQDLDNRTKALQDALTHAGAWLDDEQVDELHLVRREVIKGGLVKVVITEAQA